MVNEQDERAGDAAAPEAVPEPPPAHALVILASDDEAVCVDDLCLPAEGRS